MRQLNAELRPLSGSEEDWLARNPSIPCAEAVTELLRRCLVTQDGSTLDAGLVRQMLVGDRDAAILALRRLTFGNVIQAVVLCPACDEKMDVTFRTDGVAIEPGDVRPEYALPVGPPGSAREIRYRLPNGGDQEAVLGLDVVAARAALIARCVICDGGAALDDAARDEVEAAMERAAPQVDLDLDLACPSCQAAFTLPFDTTAFFLQEVRSGSRALLREFHSLAFHYHWSEPDILALDRRRRRAYLGLLTDELSRP